MKAWIGTDSDRKNFSSKRAIGGDLAKDDAVSAAGVPSRMNKRDPPAEKRTLGARQAFTR